MDTISWRIVQGLERGEKQRCLHVAADTQANGSCGLPGMINFSSEGFTGFQKTGSAADGQNSRLL